MLGEDTLNVAMGMLERTLDIESGERFMEWALGKGGARVGTHFILTLDTVRTFYLIRSLILNYIYCYDRRVGKDMILTYAKILFTSVMRTYINILG